MNRAAPAALLFLLACAGPPPAAPVDVGLPPSAADENAAESSPAPADPLLEAMALLKAAKDAPGDDEARERAVSAFLALARDARARGGEEAAARYRQVAVDLDPDAALADLGAPGDAPPPPSVQLDSVSAPAPPPAAPAPALDGLRLGTHHFTVRISGSRAARSAEAVVGVLEKAYLTVCGAMAANPDGKVPVILYTDREFREETGLPSWVAGAYDGTIHLPMAGLDPTAPAARNVIVHEFVHAFDYQVAKGRCPLWLDEGLAQYFEEPRPVVDHAALAGAARRGTLPPLTSPSFLTGGQGQAALLYRTALAATLFLEDRASLAAVSTFLQALGAGAPAAKAFEDTFLFPYARLQGELTDWMERRGR